MSEQTLSPYFAICNDHPKERLHGNLIITYRSDVFVIEDPKSSAPSIIISQGGTKKQAVNSLSYAITKALCNGSNGVVTNENAR